MKNNINTIKLTDKQEQACQSYIELNGNRKEAYKTAYNAKNMSDETIYVEACRLFKNPKIALRIIELQAHHRMRHDVTIDSITTELNQAKDLAQEEKQPAAMTAAIMAKAKIHGLITDKKQYSENIDVSKMTDSELNTIIKTKYQKFIEH